MNIINIENNVFVAVVLGIMGKLMTMNVTWPVLMIKLQNVVVHIEIQFTYYYKIDL
jgi:hypothetical protein